MGTFARLAWTPRYDPKFERRLPGIRVPTLVVGAEDDWLIPNLHADRWAELVPGARLERIPGTGHGLIMQAPDRDRRGHPRLHRRGRPVNKLQFYSLMFMPYPFIPPGGGAAVDLGEPAELATTTRRSGTGSTRSTST